MSNRRTDAFFYGLFMDQDLLRAKGLMPERDEIGWVENLELRIGPRAALSPLPGGRVFGVVMSLTLEEVERLYAEPSVSAYRPQAVLVHLSSGGLVSALCYNLPQPPSPAERHPDYAAKLREAATRVGLPPEYIAAIQ
jgi:hypothetical protein